MSKRILALISATLMICSSIDYFEIKNNVFKGELIKKQVSIGEVEGYDEFLKNYKIKVEEIEKQRQKELQEHARKEKEEYEKLHKIKNLDRGYSGTYRIIEVNCIVSFYTNSNSKLEGGKYDSKGRLLTSHNMNVCAAPSNISYGSFVELNGMGIYKVVDTGGAIKWTKEGNMKVDVFVPNATNEYLNKLGVKKVTGKIYVKE